jgi:15-cis-phytoene synthase
MTRQQSYDHAVRVARSRAKNFYYSFLLLPEPKRLAMCAIYAFMRECDDLSDEAGTVEAKREALRQWRAQLTARDLDSHPVWPAFFDTVDRFRIPSRYFHEMIDGVSSDLEPRRPANFDQLYRYCYHVASVVGLTITHIFGFDDPYALELAEKCGIAFQLTNIIRDVDEDRALGRIYLPEDAYQGQLNHNPEMLAALQRLGARARAYYDESRPLLDLVHHDSRAALWALMEIYSRLLRRIEQRGYDVFQGRIRLSTAEKLSVVVRAWLPGSTRT